MDSRTQELVHLSLLIERLLDSDALCAEDGAALQTEIAEARRSLMVGDLEAARQHIASLVPFTEALVHTDALDPADGRAVIDSARRLLDEHVL